MRWSSSIELILGGHHAHRERAQKGVREHSTLSPETHHSSYGLQDGASGTSPGEEISRKIRRSQASFSRGRKTTPLKTGMASGGRAATAPHEPPRHAACWDDYGSRFPAIPWQLRLEAFRGRVLDPV